MNNEKIADLLSKSTSLGKSRPLSPTHFSGQFSGQFLAEQSAVDQFWAAEKNQPHPKSSRRHGSQITGPATLGGTRGLNPRPRTMATGDRVPPHAGADLQKRGEPTLS